MWSEFQLKSTKNYKIKGAGDNSRLLQYINDKLSSKGFKQYEELRGEPLFWQTPEHTLPKSWNVNKFALIKTPMHTWIAVALRPQYIDNFLAWGNTLGASMGFDDEGYPKFAIVALNLDQERYAGEGVLFETIWYSGRTEKVENDAFEQDLGAWLHEIDPKRFASPEAPQKGAEQAKVPSDTERLTSLAELSTGLSALARALK
jgi:hypothetical protein